MTKCTMRYIFTALMYVGILVFLVPYLSGNLSAGLITLVVGFGIAILCGMMRCYFTEGDCPEQNINGKPCP